MGGEEEEYERQHKSAGPRARRAEAEEGQQRESQEPPPPPLGPEPWGQLVAQYQIGIGDAMLGLINIFGTCYSLNVKRIGPSQGQRVL